MVALNWLFIACHFMGAGFFFLFCRDSKVGLVASALASAAFSCAGFVGPSGMVPRVRATHTVWREQNVARNTPARQLRPHDPHNSGGISAGVHR
jgi:hypothetical protein